MNPSVKLRAFLVALLFLPAAIVSSMSVVRDLGAKTVIKEDTLPEVVGEWSGELSPLNDAELSMLHSPAASQRIYLNRLTGEQVQVLVLQVNNTQNAHDPRLCMAGSGFRLASEAIEPSPWKTAEGGYDVSRASFEKEGTGITMYYWMRTASGSVPNMSVGLKLEGLKQALRFQPVRGIAVRVISLPNRFEPTKSGDPAAASKLWQEIEQQIRLKGLIDGI